MQEVLILGGGVGGVVAATELSKTLKGEARITLLDREGRHYFPPSYPWLSMGWREPNQLWRPLSRLKASGVTVRTAEVTAIDPEERTVTTPSAEYPYDHLLVALGSQLDPDAIEGYRGAAHHPYDLEAAVQLRDALVSFKGGRVVVGVTRLPFKCPAAPYEVALLMDYQFRRAGMRDRVEMEFFTPEPYPSPAAGKTIGKQVQALMESRDIPIRTKRSVDHIDPGARTVHFAENGSMDYDLLVAVPPHTTAEAVRDSDLTKEGPWVPVNPRTLTTAHDDVYAVGDVASVPTPSGHVPALPKAGVFAEGQAKVAAGNIAADVAGGEGAQWDGYGVCFLETGFGRSGMVRGNFHGDGPPAITMRRPGRMWHWGKVLFERRWLGKLFR